MVYKENTNYVIKYKMECINLIVLILEKWYKKIYFISIITKLFVHILINIYVIINIYVCIHEFYIFYKYSKKIVVSNTLVSYYIFTFS